MRIILTGGGSGGHIIPNIAILKMLINKKYCGSEEVLYVGTNTGFEQKMLGSASIVYAGIVCGKLRRYRWYLSLQNAVDVLKTGVGIIQSYFIIGKFKPNVIFAKGGYVSLPVVFAGWLRRIPVVIHESDVHPGLANRISALFANVICVSVEETKNYFPSKKVVVTGIPLRSDLFDGNKNRAKKLMGLTEHIPVILFMGGGKGDLFINSLVKDNLRALVSTYQVLHLSGLNSISSNRYRRYGNVSDEMADMYAVADVVVTRAGASTLAEIAELNKPCVVIPMSKGCSRGEQVLNAEIFSKSNAASVSVLEEAACATIDLLHVIEDTLHKKPSSMGARNGINVGATEKIVDILYAFTDTIMAKNNTLNAKVSEIFQKTAGILLAVFCIPACVMIAGMIACVDGSPVFFTQERIGKNRKKFKLYKFRTLQDGKETVTGHWLRATGLDEIPQLINVMKGEMGLIGPRPLTEQDVVRLGWSDQKYNTRFYVRPGITGLGQLSRTCDKELTWQLDISYIEHRSVILDIRILTLSLLIAIFGKKRVKKRI